MCPLKSPAPRTGRWLSRLGYCGIFVWLLWLTGLLAKDRWYLTSLCFYLPSPVIGTVQACLALANRRLATILVLTAAAPMGAMADYGLAEHVFNCFIMFVTISTVTYFSKVVGRNCR